MSREDLFGLIAVILFIGAYFLGAEYQKLATENEKLKAEAQLYEGTLDAVRGDQYRLEKQVRDLGGIPVTRGQ